MKNTSTVLIVDDDDRSRALLKSVLSHESYDLIEGTNGHDAITLAAQHSPDVILLDVMMPGMDGFEACRQIRANDRMREVPVLLLTALDDRRSRLAGLEAGADDFITKPIDTAELRIRLRSITRINRFRTLYEQRARFEQAINHAPDGLVVTDAAGKITLANAAARELFSDDAPLNGRFLDLLPPETAHELNHRPSLGSPHRSHSVSAELTFARRIPNQVEIAAAPLPGDSIIFSIRDVTERKALEQQLLSVQRLEVLGQLAGGIAHDLNNLLTAVLGSASLMELDADESAQVHLKTIRTSVRRGADMLRQLLAFSRGSDGDVRLSDLTSIVREVATITSETFPSNIDVRLSSASDNLPQLRANATQLHQIFMNLCVNARDAMLPQGGDLTIKLDRRTLNGEETAVGSTAAKAGDYLTVSFTDTGSGIPPAIRLRLFEPFFSTKPEGRGTGLGLATVARLLHLHHGFITLESEMGIGTTFTCFFPVPPATG